jgi:hypothetical protein
LRALLLDQLGVDAPAKAADRPPDDRPPAKAADRAPGQAPHRATGQAAVA